MKYTFCIITFLAIASTSCSQNNSKPLNKEKIKQDWQNMYKLVKTYDQNPRVILDFSAYHCTYQILINDVPALTNTEEGDINGSVFPVSDLILKSGPQSITIRLYPAMKGDYQSEPSLTDKSKMSIKVKIGDYSKQYPEDFKTLYTLETPDIKQTNLPYAEYKGSFEAEVPYSLKGWSDGVLLQKEDQQKLLKETLTVFEQYRKANETHDVYTIADMLYKRQVENSQAFFISTKEKNDTFWPKLEESKEIISMYPIEKYKMAFFGNGHIVALVRTDNEFRGKSVIIGETKDLVSVLPIYLYRPGTGAPLEIIR
ncbi:hypothetical protein [Mucilaginibacter sp. SG564]|uniref:hypothetical protein n=1 Tax=Mucilaginibacter sp. SG564 TaxID=2587022 RepID=UPI001551BC86|nr:hypothetical protein [Mucilaginibacter sp. SG564]NOW94799.1 hypothetical protein [Mucilaginibacter sp. SG564]